MSVGKALRFVKYFSSDEAFRKACYAKSGSELEAKYGFEGRELEDALNMQVVKCQTYEEAEKYQQIKMYFKLI